MAFEQIGIRSTQQHRISPNGTSGSFGQVLHLREHVAAQPYAAPAIGLICPDVSVAWVARDREYFLVEAAKLEAAPPDPGGNCGVSGAPGKIFGDWPKRISRRCAISRPYCVPSWSARDMFGCRERATCVLATRGKKWRGLLGGQRKQI